MNITKKSEVFNNKLLILNIFLLFTIILFTPHICMADSTELMLLRAREAEDLAYSKEEYLDTIRLYRHLYVQARRENKKEIAASAMYTMASITRQKLKKTGKSIRFLKKLIQIFPETSWAGRSRQDLKKIEPSFNTLESASNKSISKVGDYVFKDIRGHFKSPEFAIEIDFSDNQWVASVGTAPGKLYTFTAPKDEMQESSKDSVPNITLMAFNSEHEIDIIDYVNRYQNTELKDKLSNYRLESQDVVNIKGIKGIQKTFLFSKSSSWFKSIQFYLAKGKKVIIITYVSADTKYLKYIRKMKNFMDSLKINK